MTNGLFHPAEAELTFSAEFGAAPPFGTVEFVQFCLEAAEASGLSQGVLDPSEPKDFDSYAMHLEVELRSHRVEVGPRTLQRYLCALGWGIWLTAEHLAGLGGRARVRESAPVERIVERLPGVWLELTASPWDAPGERLAHLEAFLAPIIATPPKVRAAGDERPALTQPEQTTPTDDYPDYRGEPVPFTLLRLEGLDVPVHVYLVQAPSEQSASALNRAVAAWYRAGVEAAFPGGVLHWLDGPHWDDQAIHLVVDIGFTDFQCAIAELMRRLAGWSAAWSCPIARVTVGYEEL